MTNNMDNVVQQEVLQTERAQNLARAVASPEFYVGAPSITVSPEVARVSVDNYYGDAPGGTAFAALRGNLNEGHVPESISINLNGSDLTITAQNALGLGGTVSGDWGGTLTSGNWGGALQSGNWGGTLQSGDWGGALQSGNWGGALQSGDWGGALQSGNWGGALQSGDWGGALQSGNWGGALQSGDWGGALQSGNWGGALQSGDWGGALQSGNWGGALQSGNWGGALQSGDWGGALQSGNWGGALQSGNWGGALQSGNWGGALQSGDWGGNLGAGGAGGAWGGGMAAELGQMAMASASQQDLSLATAMEEALTSGNFADAYKSLGPQFDNLNPQDKLTTIAIINSFMQQNGLGSAWDDMNDIANNNDKIWFQFTGRGNYMANALAKQNGGNGGGCGTGGGW